MLKALITLVLLNLLLSACSTVADKLDDLDGTNNVPDSIYDPDLSYDPEKDENPKPFFWRRF